MDERLEAELVAHEGLGRGARRRASSGSCCAARPTPRRATGRSRSSPRERSRARRSSTSSRRARSSSASESSTTRSRSASARASGASRSAGSRRRPEPTSAWSRSRGCSRGSGERGACSRSGYAFAETAYLGGAPPLRRRARRGRSRDADVEGMETVDGGRARAALRRRRRSTRCCSCPRSSTSARTTRSTASTRRATAARASRALRELRRVLARDGSLLVTVPLGEPGDHGWFRQEDERGWTRLFARAGLFVEEQRRTSSRRTAGVRRRPSARRVFATESVVRRRRRSLCTELSPGSAAAARSRPSGVARDRDGARAATRRISRARRGL